jgi:uncharacterized protein (UPF0335 family)
MNNRPTPETDAAASPHIGFYSCATVTANFVRRLEIERDEAMDELHDIRLNLGADAEGYTLLHAVCVLQQERDEAREEAHRFRSLYYSHLGINGSASWFPWEEKLGHE